jgi:hypothetical protein
MNRLSPNGKTKWHEFERNCLVKPGHGTCARVNGFLEDWTQKRVIPFKPFPELAKTA